jgi:hypothetical protein
MKRGIRSITFISGLFFCLETIGQPSHLQEQNGYISGGAYSTHFMDAFSFSSNPACIAGMKNFSVGVLTERKWMMKELNAYEFSASGNLGNGGFGIALQRTGDPVYNEQSLDLAYGKNLGRTELGIRFGFLWDQTSGYGNTGFVSCGVGMRMHITDELITGWELDLPVFGNVGKINPEKGAQLLRMGFGYEPAQYLFLAIQIEKASDRSTNLSASVEYRYGEQFFFSIGVNSAQASLFVKSGWKKNQLCIQVYTMYETVLGFSPGLVLLWQSKNRKG